MYGVLQGGKKKWTDRQLWKARVFEKFRVIIGRARSSDDLQTVSGLIPDVSSNPTDTEDREILWKFF